MHPTAEDTFTSEACCQFIQPSKLEYSGWSLFSGVKQEILWEIRLHAGDLRRPGENLRNYVIPEEKFCLNCLSRGHTIDGSYKYPLLIARVHSERELRCVHERNELIFSIFTAV